MFVSIHWNAWWFLHLFYSLRSVVSLSLMHGGFSSGVEIALAAVLSACHLCVCFKMITLDCSTESINQLVALIDSVLGWSHWPINQGQAIVSLATLDTMWMAMRYHQW